MAYLFGAATSDVIACGTGVGRILAGVVGAEKGFFTASELRATVDTGTAVVSVLEEVLG